ncbi:MAG: chlorite dismutase family protein [Cyanobacteria bacterium]|nr:chlorite dismutase family protein [Cyanobacteriota bacterium]
MSTLSTLGDRLTYFSGGELPSHWEIISMDVKQGDPLPLVKYLHIHHTPEEVPMQTNWSLTGVRSNGRYETRQEKQELTRKQPQLGRPEAFCATLIPIKKSEVWWELTQEERRDIFETQSQHISHSMQYLPAIARRLYHCRDLGEPFDFLTWFEYAPEHANAFEDLVGYLRSTQEWTFVERDISIRLIHP